MEIRKIFVVLVTSLLITAPVFAQDMIGVTGGQDGPVDPSSVIAIDSNTASSTFLSSPDYDGRGLSGVAVNSLGQVYAVTGSSDWDAPEAYLLELDRVTGQVIHEVGVLLNGAGQTGTIGDLAFQPGTDILFGISSNGRNEQFGDLDGGELMTIDTNTALVTYIGKDDSVSNDNGGLAFAPDGTLYFVSGWNSRGMFIMDPATGAYLDNIDTDSRAMGLAVRADGVIFGVSDRKDVADLHQIDPVTGAVTSVGDVGGRFLHDIDFTDFVPIQNEPVPTTNTWGLAAMMLLILLAGSLVFRNRRFNK